MKKILDLIFSTGDLGQAKTIKQDKQTKNKVTNEFGQQVKADHKSFNYGVETFYNAKSDTPDNNENKTKIIVEPQHFVSPHFDEHKNNPAFSNLANLLEQGLLAKGQGQHVIDVVDNNGLTGCGGAYFPLNKKWAAALKTPGPRYLIVNGQEGEIHTFKDYMLMKDHAETVVEGAIIAALTLAADTVIFAINSAYNNGMAHINAAIKQVQAQLPQLSEMDISVVAGPSPDLYITGEESALIEFLEQRRAEPQLKPPYPFEAGFKGQPTVVQNVESLAWLALVMAKPRLFLQEGQLKLISIGGAVKRPGIYELPLGCSLNTILQTAGGLADGQDLQAIEVGGLAGGLLPAHYLNLNLNNKELRQHGAVIGSGSVNFLSQEHDIVSNTINAMSFFYEENCGRCTPCRVGTAELVRIAKLLTQRHLSEDEQAWFNKMSLTMVNTSTCGLGKAAPSMLASLLRYWQIDQGKAELKQAFRARVEHVHSNTIEKEI